MNDPSWNTVQQRISEAHRENEKKLKRATRPMERAFICGYKIALNEVAGFLEIIRIKKSLSRRISKNESE